MHGLIYSYGYYIQINKHVLCTDRQTSIYVSRHIKKET